MIRHSYDRISAMGFLILAMRHVYIESVQRFPVPECLLRPWQSGKMILAHLSKEISAVHFEVHARTWTDIGSISYISFVWHIFKACQRQRDLLQLVWVAGTCHRTDPTCRYDSGMICSPALIYHLSYIKIQSGHPLGYLADFVVTV